MSEKLNTPADSSGSNANTIPNVGVAEQSFLVQARDEQRAYEADLANKKFAAEQEAIRRSKLPEDSPGQSLRRGEMNFDGIAEGDSSGVYRVVAETYFAQKTPEELNKVRDNYAMLVARDAEPHFGEPRATKVIPVAVHNEKASTLSHTLEQQAKVHGAEKDEIIIYGNLPDSLPESQKEASRAQLDFIQEEFRRKFPEQTLRSVCREYPEGELDINQLRYDMLELVAYDGQKRGFGYDHPVEMIDADLEQIAPTTTEVLAGKITAPDSPYVVAHAQTNYLFDKDSGFKEADNAAGIEMDDARTVAIMQEIARRQRMREWRKTQQESYGDPDPNDSDVVRNGLYHEEWGSAIALGPALMAGNYKADGNKSEMPDLLIRLAEVKDEIAAALVHAKPKVPIEAVTTAVTYFKGANIRNSGRRQEEALREWVRAPAGTDDQYAFPQIQYFFNGPSYDDFSHTETLRQDDPSGPHDIPHELREERKKRMVEIITSSINSPVMDAVLARYGLEKPIV